VKRVRLITPVAFELHLARAKTEAAVRNPVGVGNHGETTQLERLGAGASGRGSKYRPIAPAKLTYRAAVSCIQSKPRIPMLEHQVAAVGFHVH
jgi:hypothetical protein